MSEPTHSAPVVPGEVLAGKYRVEQVLGVGGMGVVVAATHIQLCDKVALKFLLPQGTQKPEHVTRFLREAQALVKIKSPHVARVIDMGTLESGAPYLVMEYLEGQDLSEILEERGHLEPTEAVHYVLQACEALAEAHAAGIVHRDLKPANMFLTHFSDGTPCIKLLDFGISKILEEVDTLTRTQTTVGSPLYMSPEQMRSAKRADARSDIWSLGIALYELLAGETPYYADSMVELCAVVLENDAPELSLVAPDISPSLQAIVARCLRKNPSERYASVAPLAEALAAELDSSEAHASAARIGRILSAPQAEVDSHGHRVPHAPKPWTSSQTASGRKLPLGTGGPESRSEVRASSRIDSSEPHSSTPLQMGAVGAESRPSSVEGAWSKIWWVGGAALFGAAVVLVALEVQSLHSAPAALPTATRDGAAAVVATPSLPAPPQPLPAPDAAGPQPRGGEARSPSDGLTSASIAVPANSSVAASLTPAPVASKNLAPKLPVHRTSPSTRPPKAQSGEKASVAVDDPFPTRMRTTSTFARALRRHRQPRWRELRYTANDATDPCSKKHRLSDKARLASRGRSPHRRAAITMRSPTRRNSGLCRPFGDGASVISQRTPGQSRDRREPIFQRPQAGR